MAYIPEQMQNTGLFVQTTNVWEISQVTEVDINSDDFRQLLVRLYQNVNEIAIALNKKQTGYYLEEEFVDSSVFFNPASDSPEELRPEYRKVIDMGSVGPGVTSKAHDLTIESTWSFTRIYGAGSNTTTNDYYPFPWASTGGATNIELKVNATDVVITNNTGLTFPTCIVVLEYLKQ